MRILKIRNRMGMMLTAVFTLALMRIQLLQHKSHIQTLHTVHVKKRLMEVPIAIDNGKVYNTIENTGSAA